MSILSNTHKMPGKSISLDARECKTGAKLAKVPGSVCHGCYALKGRYRMNNVRSAMAKRLAFMTSASFVDNMTAELSRIRKPHFRWFDSGDVQSVQMACDIVEVCKRTPHLNHWIPTKEPAIWAEALKHVTLPDNAILRVSAPLVDSEPPKSWPNTSTVHKDAAAIGHACPVKSGKDQCDTYNCRACWDKSVPNVSYKHH